MSRQAKINNRKHAGESNRDKAVTISCYETLEYLLLGI